MPPHPKNLGPCKQQACDIQSCLAEHGYQQEACVGSITALIQCCDAEVAAGREKPVHCAFGSAWRRLVEQQQQQQLREAASGGGGNGGSGAGGR